MLILLAWIALLGCGRTQRTIQSAKPEAVPPACTLGDLFCAPQPPPLELPKGPQNVAPPLPAIPSQVIVPPLDIPPQAIGGFPPLLPPLPSLPPPPTTIVVKKHWNPSTGNMGFGPDTFQADTEFIRLGYVGAIPVARLQIFPSPNANPMGIAASTSGKVAFFVNGSESDYLKSRGYTSQFVIGFMDRQQTAPEEIEVYRLWAPAYDLITLAFGKGELDWYKSVGYTNEVLIGWVSPP